MKRSTVAVGLLMLTIVMWGTVLGGIAYSHIVFFPAYLAALPDSAVVVTGPYGLNDGAFWALAHPLLIAVLAATLGTNWRNASCRKLLLMSVGIYLAALVVTMLYFVPGLVAFANSADLNIDPARWAERGLWWQRWSWLRGTAMYLGIVPLLLALHRNRLGQRTL
jgi:hypothetical protein